MKNSVVISTLSAGRWLRALAVVAATFTAASACSRKGDGGETVGQVSLALVTLTGTVTDQGGNAVPDVEVTLLDSIGDKAGAGISAADGSYVIVPSGTDIPDGVYDIVVTPPGGSIYVAQTFAGQAFSGSSSFDIVLVSGVSVTGRLVDSGASGLSGYNVCLDSLCTLTATDGSFSFSVGNGSRQFRVEGYAYPSNGYRYAQLYKNTPVVINGPVALGDVMLETRRLTGVVRDASSNPVANASVGSSNTAFNVSFGDFYGYWYGSVATASDGTFDLPVFLGSGVLSASASGHPSAAVPLTITDDTDVTIDLVGNVTGRMVDAGGAGLGNGTVCFHGSLGSACAPTQTDGTFGFAIADGAYTLGYQGYLGSTSSYASVYKSTSIVVAGATALGDVSLATRTVSGLVRDSALQPVANAIVGSNDSAFSTAFGDFTGWWYGAVTTGSDGRFALTALPGTGVFSANASGHPSAIPVVTITGDIDVTIDLVARVTGRLVDSLGAGIADQRFCLGPPSTNYACLQTASDGIFEVNIADGSYISLINGSVTTSGGYRYASLNRLSQLVVSGTTALGNIALQTRIVAGRVVDVDGFPVPNVAVGSQNQVFALSFPDYYGYWYGYSNTGGDGRFVLPVFPGTGTLVFTPPAGSGYTTFGLDNFQITNDRTLGVSVQFLRDVASGFVIAGGTITTDDNADGATESDPVDTTVLLSVVGGDGTVLIEEVPLELAPPFGYRYLTQQINVTAPFSMDPTDPLVITFRIDCSRFVPAACDQTTANSVILFRNGVQVNECNVPGAGDAIPSPCVDNRSVVGSPASDVSITVNTLTASKWTFALKLDDDADGDRVIDADDACPNEPEDVDGNEDTDGCPEFDDADGDGIDDGFDLCPTVAEDLDGNDDTDGCPELEDSDGDGIDDAVDACPSEAEDLDGNADTDGCPEVEDADGDGIPDATDACPNEAEDLDGNADSDGCPEVEPPSVRCADVTGDGRVTRRDVQEIRERQGARQGSRRYRSKYDLNRDGRITRADVLLALEQLGDRC